MRRSALILAALVMIGLALVAAVRRIPSGSAAWKSANGELWVVGASTAFVPRWAWSAAPGNPFVAELDASSREGSRIGVRVAATLPPGTYSLGPAETPQAGLARAFETSIREQLAVVPMECLAGLGGGACPPDAARQVAAGIAARLKIGADAITVQLTPDPAAVSAARRAGLAKRVGTPPRRVLVIGWDGADWEVLDPLVRRGVMPNLARLMGNGTYGELASITPLLSPLVWTTMATGVGPDEHGVLDFVEVDPATGAKVPVTGRQRRVPGLWNMATAAGLSVAVSGWWASWPAEAVNGVLVSDRLFFLLSDTVADGPPGTVVFPSSAERAYRALAERAEAETDEQAVRALLPVSAEAYRKARAEKKGMADPIDGFRRILVGTRTYFGAALVAAERRPNLEMVYCIGTDEIGHALAPYLPPPLPGADAAFSAAAKTGVERYFGVVDRWLGRLVETCPERECAILIVSDHGFKWGWREPDFTSGERGGPGGAIVPEGGAERHQAPPQRVDDRPREFSGVAAATAALWHRPRGIFVVVGNGVARLGRVREAPSVYDIAPTIAAALGLPPGISWRGRPLPGAPTAKAEPVDWRTLVPPESYRQEAGAVKPSPEYVAQLKALGYLEGGEGSGTGKQATEGELNNLGLVHLEAKRYAEAEKAFRDAIAHNAAYASPHYNLRRLYFESGRLDEADAELWRAVELGLRDAAGACARAVADYEAQRMPERALVLLFQAERRFPADPRFAGRRLGLLVKLGRCAEALESGRGAARRFQRDPIVQAFFGLGAACAGDTNAAREAFERSLAAKPDQPELRDALAALPPK